MKAGRAQEIASAAKNAVDAKKKTGDVPAPAEHIAGAAGPELAQNEAGMLQGSMAEGAQIKPEGPESPDSSLEIADRAVQEMTGGKAVKIPESEAAKLIANEGNDTGEAGAEPRAGEGVEAAPETGEGASPQPHGHVEPEHAIAAPANQMADAAEQNLAAEIADPDSAIVGEPSEAEGEGGVEAAEDGARAGGDSEGGGDAADGAGEDGPATGDGGEAGGEGGEAGGEGGETGGEAGGAEGQGNEIDLKIPAATAPGPKNPPPVQEAPVPQVQARQTVEPAPTPETVAASTGQVPAQLENYAIQAGHTGGTAQSHRAPMQFEGKAPQPSSQLLSLAGSDAKKHLEEHQDKEGLDALVQSNDEFVQHVDELSGYALDEGETEGAEAHETPPMYEFNGFSWDSVQRVLEVVADFAANIADIAGILSMLCNVAGWVLGVLNPVIGIALKAVGSFLFIVEVVASAVSAASRMINAVIDVARLATTDNPEERKKYADRFAKNIINGVGRAVMAAVSVGFAGGAATKGMRRGGIAMRHASMGMKSGSRMQRVLRAGGTRMFRTGKSMRRGQLATKQAFRFVTSPGQRLQGIGRMLGKPASRLSRVAEKGARGGKAGARAARQGRSLSASKLAKYTKDTAWRHGLRNQTGFSRFAMKLTRRIMGAGANNPDTIARWANRMGRVSSRFTRMGEGISSAGRRTSNFFSSKTARLLGRAQKIQAPTRHFVPKHGNLTYGQAVRQRIGHQVDHLFIDPWKHGGTNVFGKAVAVTGTALPETAELFYAYKYGHAMATDGMSGAVEKWRHGINPLAPWKSGPAATQLFLGRGLSEGLLKKISLWGIHEAESRVGGGSGHDAPSHGSPTHHQAPTAQHAPSAPGTSHVGTAPSHSTQGAIAGGAAQHTMAAPHSTSGETGDKLFRMSVITRQMEVFQTQLGEISGVQNRHEASQARAGYLNSLPVPEGPVKGAPSALEVLDGEVEKLGTAETDAAASREVFTKNLELHTKRAADAQQIIDETKKQKTVVKGEKKKASKEKEDITKGQAKIAEGKAQNDNVTAEGNKGKGEADKTKSKVDSTSPEPADPPPEKKVPWYRIDKHAVKLAKKAWEATVGKAMKYIAERWAKIQEKLTDMLTKFVMGLAGGDDLSEKIDGADEQANKNAGSNDEATTKFDESEAQLDEHEITAEEAKADADEAVEVYSELLADAEETEQEAAERKEEATQRKAETEEFIETFEGTYGVSFSEAGKASGEPWDARNPAPTIQSIEAQMAALGAEYESLETEVSEELAEHNRGQEQAVQGGDEGPEATDEGHGETHEEPSAEPAPEPGMEITEADIDGAITAAARAGDLDAYAQPPVKDTSEIDSKVGEVLEAVAETRGRISTSRQSVARQLTIWGTALNGPGGAASSAQSMFHYDQHVAGLLADLDGLAADARALRGQGPEALSSIVQLRHGVDSVGENAQALGRETLEAAQEAYRVAIAKAKASFDSGPQRDSSPDGPAPSIDSESERAEYQPQSESRGGSGAEAFVMDYTQGITDAHSDAHG